MVVQAAGGLAGRRSDDSSCSSPAGGVMTPGFLPSYPAPSSMPSNDPHQDAPRLARRHAHPLFARVDKVLDPEVFREPGRVLSFAGGEQVDGVVRAYVGLVLLERSRLEDGGGRDGRGRDERRRGGRGGLLGVQAVGDGVRLGPILAVEHAAQTQMTQDNVSIPYDEQAMRTGLTWAVRLMLLGRKVCGRW